MVRAVANPPQAVGGAGKAAEVSPVERSSQPPPVAHSFLINAIGEESYESRPFEVVSIALLSSYESDESNSILGTIYVEY